MDNNKKKQKLSKQLQKKEKNTSTIYQQEKLKQSQNQPEEFNIAHLLQPLQENNDKIVGNFERIVKKAKLVDEPETRKEREAADRKVTASVMRQNVKKWIPIIKKNRESTGIDFTKQKREEKTPISTLSQKIYNNPIAQRFEETLKQTGLGLEAQITKQESQLMNQSGISQDESKILKRQLAQKTSLAFYQELKNKRVAKIKSKVYHRIKKRKSDKEKLKLMAQLNPIERQREIEKMKEERAKERITLRHSTKNKFTQQLMRFGGDKKSLLQQQNFLNQLRHQLLKKAQGQFEDGEDAELDEALNDEEFRAEAVRQLENELLGLEQAQKDSSCLGLKFLERQKQDSLNTQKSSVLQLIEALRNGKEIQEKDLLQEEFDDGKSQKSQLSWVEENEKKQKEKNQKLNQEEEVDEDFVGRAVFKQKQEGDKQIVEEEKKKKKSKVTAEKVVGEFLELQEEKKDDQKQQTKEVKKNEETEKLDKIKQELSNLDETQRMINGLSLKKLKKKYQTVTTLNATADDELRKEMQAAGLAIMLDDDENENEFLKQKVQDLEGELPKGEKHLRGWGNWAGLGIKERKPPSAEELLQRKLNKIKELQRKRKDQSLEHVIINEKRNSEFSKYLVKELPYEFETHQQFDYTHAQPLGPEWNSMRTFQEINKPKVISKAGIIINPIHVPKKNEKKQ